MQLGSSAHHQHVCMRRQAALEVLRAAAACIKSAEAVKAEVAKVQKILDGSAEGRIKNATERSALVASLSAFCACPPADAAMQELAEETAEFLANYYKYALLSILAVSAHAAFLCITCTLSGMSRRPVGLCCDAGKEAVPMSQ